MRPNSSPARPILLRALLVILPRLCMVPICIAFLLPQRALAATPLDWVNVGDPGNSPKAFGNVPDPFQMSKTEVSNAQYVEFLNAVDFHGANQLGLYHPAIMTDDPRGGIVR